MCRNHPSATGDLGLANFSPQGQAEYNAKVAAFEQDLLREADRIESANNHGGPQEITPQDVIRAEFMVRQGLIKPPQKWQHFIPILATPTAGVLGGWATNNLDSGLGVLGIVVAIVVIFVSEIYKYNKESR